MKNPLPFLLLLGASIPLSCIQTDTDFVDAITARNRVNAAYISKLTQCRQPLEVILLGASDTDEDTVANCENAILSAECPLEELPIFCIQLAPLEVTVEIPDAYQIDTSTDTSTDDGLFGGVTP